MGVTKHGHQVNASETHKNVRSHTYLITRKELMELGWTILLHPLRSLDLATSEKQLQLLPSKAVDVIFSLSLSMGSKTV